MGKPISRVAGGNISSEGATDDFSVIVTDGVHLVAAKGGEEALHRFARRLGLKREWYQDGRNPHYDLTTPRMTAKAFDAGAILVTERDLAVVLKNKREGVL